MNVIVKRERPEPLPNPVSGVTLELSPEEFHDLQTIARIPQDALRKAIDCIPVRRNRHTFGVYTLQSLLQEITVPGLPHPSIRIAEELDR